MIKRRKKTDFLRFLALLFVLFGMVHFYLYFFTPRLISPLFRFGVLEKEYNILILGTDFNFDLESHRRSAGRTDSILFLHYKPWSQKFHLLSIPRDSYVNIPGYGLQKINSAYVLGQINLIKETVEKLLSKKIDRYVILNTGLLVKTVDLVGGINLYVDRDMNYIDNAQKLNINLKQGYQHLNGTQAHQFIRFRHDAMGDITRVERQQVFFKALLAKLANPFQVVKAPMMLKIMRENLETDLSLRETVLLLNSARMMGRDDLKSFLLPGNTIDNGPGNWFINQPEINKLMLESF
ncbi:hypothetical protein A2276_08295 [candidate division WOR-1 bacterium RIFOXYA12_FULL_43_27]|uniref:Cell envelope-related transcriptional attenuator domain-containing protein n=1 Tax=candidate division WOR-1 bacterium RIFOXYC2_FULL_46_14 TaxID=1802587 RepID=A0A1F4U639_UNCSA|nr:MAG: hypothetical protein A2276_08295 [candidate division WOR-1 bacterium RIFOXYA12_FULL_43_27]OGC20594.1 MAG: hypothetical protein A2292_06120 [candidate division WOR-1 bacterium RIFOXYB2_FULL_46_45]OGC31669.1 MAG: hypothetical protein A2232_05330 [candidate division WOR-1 bacterium RIFOXYA2_FULL_46_56]OGC40435.1 MAG: hypothetical protein A2438_04150 [candidate division WOR-1 bacterium RIFOXYC2_FULL_46_14]